MDKGMSVLAILGRYKFVLLVAALGAVLLLWPGGESSESSAAVPQVSTGESTLHDLERDMEEILSKMSGVGRVDVMLTLQSGGELILAENTTLRYSGSPQNPDDYDRSSETVTVSGGDGVVVTEERSPQYRGALVVCDGGDNDNVRLRVMEAVSALTGLGSDRIAVVRWGESMDTGAEIENKEDLT